MKLLIAAFFLISSLNLFAEGMGHKGGKGMHEGKMEGMFKELNLTDEQKMKMKALREEKKSKRESQKDEFKTLHDALHAKLKSDATNEEILKAFNDLHEKKSAKMREHFEHMLKIRAILTPEQRVKFYEMKEKRKMGKGKGHKMGGHGGMDDGEMID